MLAEFDLVTPRTLDDALDLLADESKKAVPLAGGTNLVMELRDGDSKAGLLVNIEDLPEIVEIRLDGGYLVIGGGVTLAGLLQDERVEKYASPLWQAARLFANPLIRNRATVGGNLADASPAADTAPPLLALNAEIELRSRAGSRWLPLDQFFVGVRRTQRQVNELITSVRIPISNPGMSSGFYKLGLRKADAISIASAAVVVEKDGDGICRAARIALGSVAPRPVRAKQAEAVLVGQRLQKELIIQASQLAAAAASPISDLRATADYRRQMVPVLVRRVLGGIA